MHDASRDIVDHPARHAWRGLAASIAMAACLAPLAADAAPERPADRPGPGWQQVRNTGPVFGLDGKPHSASCSGYPGTDPSYRFWAKRGKSKNLVVYFEGGGACWDNLTCTFPIMAGLPEQVPQFFDPAITPDTDPATYDGIFNAGRADNPVKDWSFVYLPYCSGDVHVGSATRTYLNAGHPVFTQLPGAFDIQHRGFDNFMVALDWMKRHVDAPQQILVAGSSAGGYGASVNFPWVQRAFPRAKLAVVADASQGVSTPAFDTGTPGRGSWNPQLARWVFGDDATKIRSNDYLRRGAMAYPKTRVAQFTTTFDTVQMIFYGAMKQYYGPGGSCSNLALDWNRQMVGTLKSYAASTPNYRYYLASGQYHTILRDPQFYLEKSAGVPFTDWLDDMLDGRESRFGFAGWNGHWPPRPSDWRNAACPGCLLELPCPG